MHEYVCVSLITILVMQDHHCIPYIQRLLLSSFLETKNTLSFPPYHSQAHTNNHSVDQTCLLNCSPTVHPAGGDWERTISSAGSAVSLENWKS